MVLKRHDQIDYKNGKNSRKKTVKCVYKCGKWSLSSEMYGRMTNNKKKIRIKSNYPNSNNV